MKKIHFYTLCILGTFSINAQSYIGFLTDNYSGVHGVINNPASIADSRFQADINLIGASGLLGNDYYGFNVYDLLFDDDYELDDEASKSPKNENNFYSNIDILGPSFMFNINDKSALAIFTRARTFYNVNSLNLRDGEDIGDNFDENESFSFNEGDAYSSNNNWAEIGISYARVLMEKDAHFLKGGLSLKYLIGLGNAYATTNNLSVDYNANVNGTPGNVTTTGELNYGYSDNFDNFDDFNDEDDEIDEPELEASGSGFGVDLGFIYEWRPDADKYTYKDNDGNTKYYRDVNKYKLKLGLSVTDLGSINYDGIQETYNINGTVNQTDFENIENTEDIQNAYNTTSVISEAEKAVLPTALHFNADWNFNQKFYLNLNTDLSLTAKDKSNRNQIANMVSLTPRFERKWFTFQMPISVQQYSGFQWGAGLRAGPLYVGSGSLMTAFFNDESKAADIYVGLKVPIYQSRPKDKDGDGVFDKLDNCPDEAGPVENQGCPWGDADKDKILDNEDNCPNEAGPAENNGCPWGDKDNDGILDNVDECPNEAGTSENNGCPLKDTDGDSILDKEDNCPNEAGPVENNGCPWGDTDGDGVTDNIDDCPTTVGTIANKGCPEVTAEVQKTLNSYAKTILFDSGKSSIKAESNQVLNDIVKILNEYPNANFSIEGHTDSAGSNALNQKLSDSRASAVKIFLIENGINQSRLSSVGYGEDKPIASNATRAGRAQNRRVEINLVK